MKKLITTIGLGVIMALTSVTFAQDQPQKVKKEDRKNMSTEERAKHKTDKMTKLLKLSEVQTKQVYDVNLKFENEVKAIRTEAKKIKEAVKVKRLAKRTEIEKILTPEQLEKVKEMEAKRKAKRQSKAGENRPK